MPFTTRAGLGWGPPADEVAVDAPAPPSRRRAAHYAALFASLTTKTGAAVAAAAGAAASAATRRPAVARTEPRTHTPFTADYCHLSKRDCPELAGVG